MKVEEFLELFQPTTARIYKIGLDHFFRSLDIKPEDYFKTERDFKQDVNTFNKYMSGRPPKTVHTYMMAVKQYLTESNDSRPKTKQIPVDTIFKRQRRRERKLKVVKALTEDYLPSIEELRSLLAHAKLKDRALILVLLSSGMRIGECIQLKISDIDFETEPARITIPPEITKTGSKRITFLTPEAVETLREWIKSRESFEKTAGLRHYQHIKGEDLVFPFCYETAHQSWNRLLAKVDIGGTHLGKKDSRTSRHQSHLHCLRKIFRSRLPSTMGIDMVEALMGHEGYLTSEYRRFTDKELAEAYLQGCSVLCVFQVPADLTAVNADLKTKDEQIKDLKNKLDNLTNLLGLKQQLEGMIKGK